LLKRQGKAVLTLLLKDFCSICHSNGMILWASEALILSYRAWRPFSTPLFQCHYRSLWDCGLPGGVQWRWKNR